MEINNEAIVALSGTLAVCVTGINTYMSRRVKRNVESGIKPHLETLAERVAGIEGRLGGIEENQKIILERLIQNGK